MWLKAETCRPCDRDNLLECPAIRRKRGPEPLPKGRGRRCGQTAAAGAHLIFAPATDEIYGEDFATAVILKGPAKANLEDKFRPHFFDGVATIVAKLFIQSGADFAIFGQKDYQQLQVVDPHGARP